MDLPRRDKVLRKLVYCWGGKGVGVTRFEDRRLWYSSTYYRWLITFNIQMSVQEDFIDRLFVFSRVGYSTIDALHCFGGKSIKCTISPKSGRSWSERSQTGLENLDVNSVFKGSVRKSVLKDMKDKDTLGLYGTLTGKNTIKTGIWGPTFIRV